MQIAREKTAIPLRSDGLVRGRPEPAAQRRLPLGRLPDPNQSGRRRRAGRRRDDCLPARRDARRLGALRAAGRLRPACDPVHRPERGRRLRHRRPAGDPAAWLGDQRRLRAALLRVIGVRQAADVLRRATVRRRLGPGRQRRL